MPDWVVQGVFGVLLSIIGYLVVRIDKKLDRIDERQSKIEKDCVTWSDLEKERLRISDHDRRITIVETTCQNRHGD